MTHIDDELSVETMVAEAVGNNDAEKAIDIATKLLARSQQLQTPQERRQQAELDRMISRPDDKATLVEMTDQAFRTLTPARVADQLTHILDLQGVPRFFSPLERTMLMGFQSFGEYLPGVAVPLVKDKMRRETANVILPAEEEMLSEHLRQRQKEGVRMNVNLLGEALLGEDEAKRRLQRYLDALRMPEVECVSVKITTIYSQVSPISREHTTRIVADRMELLYRASLRETFQRADGTTSSRFVYLDMEEYRDLYLTVDAMFRALDRPGVVGRSRRNSIAGLCARFIWSPAASAGVVAQASRGRRRSANDPAGEGCEPGDGTRGGFHGRLALRALRVQT